MEFDEYSLELERLGIGGDRCHSLLYLAVGLAGEAGEVCNEIKKYIRDYDGIMNETMRNKILDEAADTLFYLDWLVRMAGSSMNKVARHSLDKVANKAYEIKARDAITYIRLQEFGGIK